MWGDSAFYQWCKYPESRRTSSLKGVTDVPAFDYDASTGKCLITKPYCDWMEVSFEESNKDGYPDCYLSGGQKFSEKYFFGRTIFRGVKKFFQGGYTEGYQQNPPPRHFELMIDPKKMKSYKNIGPNFAGKGINLYQIVWADDAVRFDKNAYGGTVGFLSSEIKKKYPELISNKNGLEWIEMDIEDGKKNNDLKRIYLTISSGSWMLENIKKFLEILIPEKTT